MNIFVLTSEFEGTPNVVLEAQWLGLPIVATNSGGTGEAVKRGISGEIADSATKEELASHVISFLVDEPAVNLASLMGPKFVADYFGKNRMITDTLVLYELNQKD